MNNSTKRKSVLVGAFCTLLAFIAINGCSKDEASPGDGFKLSDIEVFNIVAEQDGPGSQVAISYDVKNVSGKDIPDYATFDIRWTVKTTDGTLYQTERGVAELLKDAVAPQDAYISVSSGKSADLSTLAYELLLDEYYQ